MSMRHGTWANPDIIVQPRRNRTRANIAAGVVVIAASLLLVGAIGYGATSMFKDTDVYRLSMALVKSDKSVQRALGDPIKTGWLTTGSITLTGSGGNAELSIPISGSLNNAVVHSRATRAGGVWTIDRLSVLVNDNPTPIVLIDENRNRGPQRVAYS